LLPFCLFPTANIYPGKFGPNSQTSPRFVTGHPRGFPSFSLGKQTPGRIGGKPTCPFGCPQAVLSASIPFPTRVNNSTTREVGMRFRNIHSRVAGELRPPGASPPPLCLTSLASALSRLSLLPSLASHLSLLPCLASPLSSPSVSISFYKICPAPDASSSPPRLQAYCIFRFCSFPSIPFRSLPFGYSNGILHFPHIGGDPERPGKYGLWVWFSGCFAPCNQTSPKTSYTWLMDGGTFTLSMSKMTMIAIHY
jgi:hypothetical protein